MGDMSEEEKAGYMGLKLPEDLEVSEWTPATEVDSRVPSSLDWRTDSCLQPIKNQGQCGSCWAFSAIASFEFQYCKTYDSGCEGGWYYNAWKYLHSHGSNSGYEYAY